MTAQNTMTESELAEWVEKARDGRLREELGTDDLRRPNNLLAARMAAGLSQQQLVDLVTDGMYTRMSVTNWEHGVHSIPSRYHARVDEILGPSWRGEEYADAT